jgi:hypothetical protein
MIHLPERLINFYNSSKTLAESMPKEQAQLDPAEYGPLTYVAGYVIAKLYQLSRTKKGENSQELQRLLQSIRSSEIIKLYIRVRSFSYARDLITKYNIKAKQLKKKALRTDLKRK